MDELKNTGSTDDLVDKRTLPKKIKVEVTKEHCGIKKGTKLMKPRDIAMKMIEKGYYKQLT